MGRRRKRRKKIIVRRRRIPSVFQCPSCGYTSVTVSINRKEGKVLVKCASCGLEQTFDLVPYLEPVDYYSRFLDHFEEQVSLT